MSAHDARGPVDSRRLAGMEWRVGGSVGRTVYAGAAEHEHARDDHATMIGVFDSHELAQVAVDDHNTMHAARQGIHAYGPVPEIDGEAT